MDDNDLALARRLVRQMESEAIKYNDAALVRRIKFWRRMIRDEERLRRAQRG